MTEYDATVTGNVHILRRQRDARRHSLEQFEGDGVRLTSKRASRQHAFLRLHGTDCMLFDNDSHNGVFLNGVKVYSAVLRDGDVIQVADSIFVYSED
jgi:pSer/pThr/pTyr-binding forkhead associated (FHA) protein